MRKLRVLSLLCCTILPSGCRSPERTGVCEPISTSTRVVIQASHGVAHSDLVITDPARIHEIAAFANARREAYQASLYTMPAPEVSATFYNDNSFLGSVGAGENFLFVSCAAWKGIRDATPTEIETFKGLIAPATSNPKPRS